MDLFILFFIPSVISVKIHGTINKVKSKDFINLITTYLLYVLMNYVFSLVFSILFFDLNIGLTKAITEYNIFSIKYLLVSMVFSIIIPFGIKFVKENIKIKLEKR